MKVWFGTTSLELGKYYPVYKNIRDYLIEKECIILFDWLDNAYSAYINGTGKSKRNIKKIYKKVTEAIEESDIVVIEYTVPNFSSSHQINYALYKRKPTLVLRLHKDNAYFAGSYIEAIESQYLTIKEYTKENYKQKISEFIGEQDLEFGMKRYNVVLDRKQKYFLDWAASFYKKSRSEIIRTALDNIISKDKRYKEYISK